MLCARCHMLCCLYNVGVVAVSVAVLCEGKQVRSQINDLTSQAGIIKNTKNCMASGIMENAASKFVRVAHCSNYF
jgi:hypothetical protein